MMPFYEEKSLPLYSMKRPLGYFPSHMHINLELLYIITGTAEVLIGTQKITLQQHDLAMIFPNTIHSFLQSSDNCQIMLSICNQSLFGEYTNKLIQSIPTNPIIPAQNIHPDIVYALNSLYYEYQHSKEQNQQNLPCIKALVSLILSRTIPFLHFKKSTTFLENDMTSKVIHYVCNHFTRQLSLDLLSSELGMNKYYISRIFTKKIGLSFNDYVNNLRIDYAKKLLTTTTLSILDIAFECGFETQRTFNRTFKQFCTVSPLKYRNTF